MFKKFYLFEKNLKTLDRIKIYFKDFSSKVD